MSVDHSYEPRSVSIQNPCVARDHLLHSSDEQGSRYALGSLSRLCFASSGIASGENDSLLWLADTTWVALIARYAIVIAAIGIQLVAYHLWLAAGQRRLGDVWPGVVLSILLWVIAAQLFASWLTINDYSRFYAGLTRIMSALVFFQVSAIIVIVGAELNRGIVEVKRRLALAEERNADVTTMPLPPSGDSYRVEH